MKSSIFFLLLSTLFLLCCCSDDPIQQKKNSFEQQLDTTSYVDGGFSFDEKRILFSCNENGTFNAYSMSILGPLEQGKAIPLTNSTNRAIYALTYFPNDDRILFSEDGNENGRNHIYLREANGTVRDLVSTADARAEYYGWTHDHTSFIYGTNVRDPQAFDIYEMDIDTLAPRLIFQNEESLIFGCASPDRRYLAFSKALSATRVDMYIYDIETGTLTNLSQQKTDAARRPQTFSLDSHFLYYLTNEDSDCTYVKKIDLSTGKTVQEYKEPCNITQFFLSHNGSFDILTVDEEGEQKSKIFHHQSKSTVKLPKGLKDNIVRIAISRSEGYFLFAVNNAAPPAECYLYDVAKKTATRLTFSLHPAIDEKDLVEGDVPAKPSWNS